MDDSGMAGGCRSVQDAFALCKRSLVSAFGFSGAINLLMLTPAFYMLSVYDKALAANSTDTLTVLTAMTAIMFFSLAVLEVVRSKILVAISVRVEHLLAPTLYDVSFRNALNVGQSRATAQAMADLSALRQFVTGPSIAAIFDAPWVPLYLAVLFAFHPLLGVMGLGAVVVFLLLAISNQVNTTPPLKRANELSRGSLQKLSKNLQNAEVVFAMGMLPMIRRRWRSDQAEILGLQESATLTAGWVSAATKTLRLAVQSAAIGAGAYLAIIQEISAGMIIAGSILMGRALQPVELAVGAWRGLSDARDQYGRIKTLLDEWPFEMDRMQLPELQGRITANGAAIMPPASKQPTVVGLNFDCPAGSTCLVLGPSGAGKSSLIRGLLGLWPTPVGELRLDGVEASQYDRDLVGSQIGYLPQDIELFSGTIAENIARFEEIDPEAVVQAAEDARVHELILSLGEGYDTELGGPGGLLSPGQKQRIALARALYRRPKLVVLDEPNSNLDDAGEDALSESISRLNSLGTTVVVVSHRQKVIQLADYIIFIAGGKMLDAGPSHQVLARLQNRNAVVKTTPDTASTR